MGSADAKVLAADERGAALLSAKGGPASDGSATSAAADACANPYREIAEAGIAARERGDKGARRGALGARRARGAAAPQRAARNAPRAGATRPGRARARARATPSGASPQAQPWPSRSSFASNPARNSSLPLTAPPPSARYTHTFPLTQAPAALSTLSRRWHLTAASAP